MSPDASNTTSKNENLEFPVVNGAFFSPCNLASSSPSPLHSFDNIVYLSDLTLYPFLSILGLGSVPKLCTLTHCLTFYSFQVFPLHTGQNSLSKIQFRVWSDNMNLDLPAVRGGGRRTGRAGSP